MAAVLLMLVAAVLAPVVLGWARPTLSRATVLDRSQKAAGPGVRMVGAKYVLADDFAAAFPEDPPHTGFVWVVVTASPNPTACANGCGSTTWSGLILNERAQVIDSVRVDTGIAPPTSLRTRFDGLRDRMPPVWWLLPVVSTAGAGSLSVPLADVAPQVALVVVLLIALATVVALARGIRFAVSRGARRLGRPT